MGSSTTTRKGKESVRLKGEKGPGTMIPAVFSKRSLAHEYADKVRKTQRGYWHGKPDQLPFEAIVIEVQLPD